MKNAGSEFQLDEAIRLLESTPAALGALLADLPDGWLNYQEDTAAWSPRIVLIHYIHNERTNWMPRLRVILSEGEGRRFAPFEQMPDLAPYQGRSAGELAEEFADLRARNLTELRSLGLGPETYARQGEHPVLGTVNLGQLLATWVVHDLNHLHQIAKTLAKRYRQLVGPWRPNLNLLDL